MNHNTNKTYYEYLAKCILETFLPSAFSDIILTDKPDLINSGRDGIEVTRALFAGDGEASGRFQRIKDKPIDEIDKRDLTRLEQLDCDVMYFDGKAGGYCPPAHWCTLSEIQESFTAKLNKASTYGNTASLFIYSPMFNWYEPGMMEEFTQWASALQRARETGFSTVYVFEYTSLYICDLATQEVIKIDLEHDAVQKCCESALEYVKQLEE